MDLDIASMVAQAKPGSTITLPEGRFRLMQPLVLSQNNITLAGQGIGKTVLAADFAGIDSSIVHVAGQQPSEVPYKQITNLSVSAADDSQHITIKDVTHLHVGDTIMVRYKNDEMFLRELDSKVWKAEQPSLRQTMNRIVAINGNEISLAYPLGMSFPENAQLMALKTAKNVTVKDMTLEYDLGCEPDASVYENVKPEHKVNGLSVTSADNPTIENIEVINAGKHAFNFDRVLAANVSHVKAQGAWNKGAEGNGYYKLARTYHSQMDDVFLRGLRHLTIQWSAHDNRITNVDSDCDINFHGGFTQRNYVQATSVVPREGHKWGKVYRTPDTARWAPPDGEGNIAVDADGKEIDFFLQRKQGDIRK